MKHTSAELLCLSLPLSNLLEEGGPGPCSNWRAAKQIIIFNPLSLPNLEEAGSLRQCSRQMATKAYSLRSHDSFLPCDSTGDSTGNTFVVCVILRAQILSWFMYGPRKNDFIMLHCNVSRLLGGRDIRGRSAKEGKVEGMDWAEFPLELLWEIGKCLVSRVDVIHFRSVCSRWRTSLPPPTRFPLLVPRPPNDNLRFKPLDDLPYFITETNIYSDLGGLKTRPDVQRVLMEFEELDQGVKFRAFAYLPGGAEFDLPTVVTSDPEHHLSRLSFVAKAYYLRLAFPSFDSLKKRVEGKWSFRSSFVDVHKIVLISSNNADASYAPASDLSAVVLLREEFKLALLRLGGSTDPNWNWDTSFCSDHFEDIATYKGQLCTVDHWGRAFLMDYNSLVMTQIAAPLSIEPHLLRWKHLLEICGDLYLFAVSKEEEDIMVFKLSFRLGKWLEVDDIGDQVFWWDAYWIRSVPREVLTSVYGSWMEKCKGPGYFTPPALILPCNNIDKGYERGYGAVGYGSLSFTLKHCIPWLPRPEASTASTTTTTSVILSQYDNSIVGQTNYFEIMRSTRRST